jgi:hypothetical protein
VLAFLADHLNKERSKELSTVCPGAVAPITPAKYSTPRLLLRQLAGSISYLYTAKYYLKFREFFWKIFTECSGKYGFAFVTSVVYSWIARKYLGQCSGFLCTIHWMKDDYQIMQAGEVPIRLWILLLRSTGLRNKTIVVSFVRGIGIAKWAVRICWPPAFPFSSLAPRMEFPEQDCFLFKFCLLLFPLPLHSQHLFSPHGPL